MDRGRAPNGIGHLMILKLSTPIKNIIETQSTHKFPYNILFTFSMDRGRAPNGIGHLIILARPKGTPEGRAVSVTRELDLSLLCRV